MKKIIFAILAVVLLCACESTPTEIYEVRGNFYQYTNRYDLDLHSADALDGKTMFFYTFDFDHYYYSKRDSVFITFVEMKMKKVSEDGVAHIDTCDTLRCAYTQTGNKIKMTCGKKTLYATSHDGYLVYKRDIYKLISTHGSNDFIQN